MKTMEGNNIHYLFKEQKLQHSSIVNTNDTSAMQETRRNALILPVFQVEIMNHLQALKTLPQRR